MPNPSDLTETKTTASHLARRRCLGSRSSPLPAWRNRWPLLLLFALAGLTLEKLPPAGAGRVQAAPPGRYVARFQNGTVVEGNQLSDWQTPEATPKLDAHVLLDASNPLRWLVDRALPPFPPRATALVEMTTGDCLPGSVVDFRSGAEFPYAPVPAHFLVRYDGPHASSLEDQPHLLRIDARYVRRVVWSRRPQESLEPRTVFLRDGSFLRFRSLRWSPGSLSLLLETGLRRVAWSDVAEVHLPPPDFWPTYFDELTTLAPDGQRRLLQVETDDGLIATTSLDRLQPRFLGDPKDPNRWLLGIQPAWSLDLFWLGQGSIRVRRSFPPQEVPLSRVPPVRAEQRIPAGTVTFPFQVNRSVQAGPLRALQREAGWGFGVQAASELEFAVPASARTLRGEFAVDAAMQRFGCVQPRVLNASAGNAVLYQGPIVTGADKILDLGSLGIAGSGDAPRRIVLQVDPVVNQRPPQADPLGIRDQANWLDPTLELDPTAVKQQIDQRLTSHHLAWQGWDVAIEPGGQLHRASFFAEGGTGGEYHTTTAMTGAPLRLSQKRPLLPRDQWLVIDAVRTQAGPPSKLSAKLGEGAPAEWELPTYDKNRSDFRPWILPLAELGRQPMQEVAIEVRQLPTAERIPVLWRALTLAEQHPLFHRVLEDPPAAASDVQWTVPAGGQPDAEQKYRGEASLRLPPAAPLSIRLARPLAIRERPQLGQYRFLRFAVRSQGGSGLRLQLQGTNADAVPMPYVAGAPDPAEDPRTKRLGMQPLPPEWQLFTRDLYGDFGNVDLQGLTVEFVGGEAGWIDHVYLARSQNDYELIPQ